MQLTQKAKPTKRQADLERPGSFGRTFCWVMLAHLLILGLLLFFRVPENKPVGETQLMEMVAMPTTASHAVSPKAPAQAPRTPPSPPAPVAPPTPAPVKPETPTPTPPPVVQQPTPVVALPPIPLVPPPQNHSQSSFVVPSSAPPKPAKKVEKKSEANASASKPDSVTAKPKTTHTVEVSLTPITRSSSTAHAASTHAAAASSQSSPEVSSQEIAAKLAQELSNSGSTRSIGKVAVSSGGSPGQFGAFYQLIREQMYQVWEPPPELIGFKQGTEIQIQVGQDGTILDATIKSSSGNSKFDERALAAARKVGKLREPRPEGCPEFITVNFRLAES